MGLVLGLPSRCTCGGVSRRRPATPVPPCSGSPSRSGRRPPLRAGLVRGRGRLRERSHRRRHPAPALPAVAPSMVVGVLRPDVLDVRGVVVWGVVTVGDGDRLPRPLRRHRRGHRPARRRTVTRRAGAHRGGARVRLPSDDGHAARRRSTSCSSATGLIRSQAATDVVDQIGDDPVLALRAIREALVLPYASLRVEGADLATSGTEVTHTRTLPLQLGADAVGEIVVGLRAGDLTLAAADADVLRIVAPLLAQTLRAQALARDLQASRNAAITAIEEERRRLRRDLHDGLGPTLSGVAFADGRRSQPAQSAIRRRRTSCSRSCGPTRRRPSPRFAASSRDCGRRHSTSSACSARCASTPRRCTPTGERRCR